VLSVPSTPLAPSATSSVAAEFSRDMVDVPMSNSLRALALRGEIKRLRKGVQIISEGDVANTLYIVLKGQLRAFATGSDARELTYATYGPGEYVGEMSLDDGPRTANVETLVATVVSVVRRDILQRHLDADPQFAFELLAKVIRRARAATLGLKQIALNDVYGRLKALLEELALPQPDGTCVADPAPSHKEMSQRLGCGREMVSRVMKDLERGGYVEVGRRRVVLHKALPAKW
jgi:CRP/FNR family transcriptional regulator, cyclic AMP receptor protein